MKCSVIILSWNGMAYLGPCLDTVLGQQGVDFEVIVVDNGSTDGSPDWVAEHYPQVRLICNERNLGFAAGNNVGLRAAAGDVLVLLNQDTEVRPGWLAALAEAVSDPAVGIAGAKLLYPDGTIQHAGGHLHGPRGRADHIGRHEPDEGQYDEPREVDFVTGASIALSRAALERIGLLDEGFPLYFEDTDWCYRAREAGLRVLYYPAATAVHYESTSIDAQSYAHLAAYDYGRLRFLFKHQPRSWLQDTFTPAETEVIQRLGHGKEMMAVREATFRLFLSLPDILAFRLQPPGPAANHDPQAEAQTLLELASQLRDACVQPQSLEYLRSHLDRVDKQAASPTEEGKWERLRTEYRIEEQPFHSDLPLIGPAVAAFRSAWNNVATRWYVLPLVQQQTDFNELVARLLSQTASIQMELGHTQRYIADLLAEQSRTIAQTIREVNRLAHAIFLLQERIETLEKER